MIARASLPLKQNNDWSWSLEEIASVTAPVVSSRAGFVNSVARAVASGRRVCCYMIEILSDQRPTNICF